MKPARVRIVHLIESLGVGGAERRLVSDLRWLDRRRYEHRVVYLTPADALRAEIEALGVPTYGLGMRGLRDWRSGLVRLTARLRAWRPHVVHTQVFGADVYGRLAARLAGVPAVVSTVQTMPYDPTLSRFYSRKRMAADRWTARWCARRLIAVSEPVRDALVERFGLPASRICVIPNGVDLVRCSPATESERAQARLALGLPQETLAILTVGRLIPEKNHAALIAACGLMRERHPVRLLIAGDGPLRAELESLVARLELTDYVSLLGTRSDVPRLLQAADLFVLPSIREGLPVALLEAMASAVPVVASDIPQHRTIVQAGSTGWLVPPQDEGGLAEAALSVARDPIAARAVGQRGRSYVVEHFSSETLARRLQALYDELCAAGAN
ncbi:MAG: glycosyltransferase [Candidatus Omnitrophica bacterium]|nr:glycosyltransferase [Candidatus Omnitrophota bacterium]